MLRDDPVLVRILKNSGWLLSAKALSLPLQVAQSVLVARLLGVSGFGMLGVIVVYVTTSEKITSFRMNEVVVKFMTDAVVGQRMRMAAATLKGALLAEAWTTVFAFTLVWITVPYVAPYFIGDASANSLICLYTISSLIDIPLESSTAVLQVFDRYRVQAIGDVLGRGATLVAVAVVYALHGTMVHVIIAYLIGNLISTGVITVFAMILVRERLGAGWWRTPLAELGPKRREMTKFALSTNVGGTLSLIVKDSELLWLSFFTTPAAAGIYKLAKSWIAMVVIPAAPLVKSFYPEITRSVAANELDRTKKLLRKGTLLAAAWIVPIGVGFLAVSYWLVPWLYGRDYSPAVPTFAILIAGIGYSDILFWMRPCLLAFGRPDVALKITTLHAVLKIVLVITLVPLGGHLAMAGITSFLFVLGTTIGTLFILKCLRERRP